MRYSESEHDIAPEAGGAPPGAERRRTSLRDFLSVVFRRKGIVLAIFLMAVVAVLVVNASTPTMFESFASVLVSRGQPQTVFGTGYKLLSWEEELNSELEVLKSRQIYEIAQRDLNRREARDGEGEPIRINPLHIRGTIPGKSSVINIAYRSEDPVAARQVTQALSKAYMDFRHETRGGPEVEAYLQDQITQIAGRLEEWEGRKAQYMAEARINSPKDERYFLLQERRDTQTDLNELQALIAERRAQVEVLRRLQRERRENPGLQILPFSNPATREESAIDMLLKETTLRRSEYYDLAARYTETHPEVQSKRRHLLDLEAALDREIESYLRHLEARIEVLRAQEAPLSEIIEAVSMELAELPSKEMQLNQIDRVINGLQTQYSALVSSSIDARITRTGSADWNVILLSPASQPYAIRVHDYVRLAILPLFSLILGIGLAFLVDSLDHSIKDAADVETYVGLPVLTSVSRFGGR